MKTLTMIRKRFHMIVKDIVLNTIGGSYAMPRTIRFMIYKTYGINTETRNIFPKCFIGGNNIKIGKGTFVNSGCYFDNSSSIVIGANCQIGMHVLFCSSSHEIGSTLKRGGKNLNKPVIIGDGCWIGARATILPGVTIGNGVIIAAGTVVTKDCEENWMYAGVPAKKIKYLEKDECAQLVM
ncbi:acyltransferase [Terribacillus saccharophilus]|uniref:acyltransferase n=1 Tax=Terribacillus saccharophilus TaxID=361277 RepID=UPI0026E581A7|nr:DapH/DapD/GlmU-related protein [Terribacillus saccharophilus]